MSIPVTLWPVRSPDRVPRALPGLRILLFVAHKSSEHPQPAIVCVLVNIEVKVDAKQKLALHPIHLGEFDS